MKMPPKSKVCATCGLESPAENFYRHGTTSDGLHMYCKPCDRKRRNDARIKQGKTPL